MENLIPVSFPGQIAAWLWCAVAVLAGVKLAADFWADHVKEKPTPADTYATKADHDRLETEFRQYQKDEPLAAAARRKLIYEKLESNRAALATQIDGLRAHTDTKIDGLHERITTLALNFTEGLSEIKGQMKVQNRSNP